jgi:hypothetical protein
MAVHDPWSTHAWPLRPSILRRNVQTHPATFQERCEDEVFFHKGWYWRRRSYGWYRARS